MSVLVLLFLILILLGFIGESLFAIKRKNKQIIDTLKNVQSSLDTIEKQLAPKIVGLRIRFGEPVTKT